MPQDAADTLSSGLTEAAMDLLLYIDNLDERDENVIESWAMMKAIAQKVSHVARDIAAAVESKGLDIVRVQGEFNVGPIRYYAGDDRKVKQMADSRAVAEAIIRGCGGDEEAIYPCMSANPWKQGTIKKLLGDEVWSHLFAKVDVNKLKTGVPKLGLRSVDTDFIKKISAKESDSGDTNG